MRPVSTLLLSFATTAALASMATAQTVDFESGTTTPFGWLPDGYAGYKWSNGFAIDPMTYFHSATAAGGFGKAIESGKHVLGNGGGNALVITAADGGLFNFMGGTFAAAWRNGLLLNIRGFSAGNEIFTQALTLDWSNPQNVNLSFFGVDKLVFETTGGSWDPNLPKGNTSFAADDLAFSTGDAAFRAPTTVTPEPVTWALMATGLVGMAAVNLVRRRRASSQTS